MCTQKVPYCYMPINIFVIALLKNMNLVCPVIAAFAEISTSFNTKLTHTLITNRYKFFVMLINQTNVSTQFRASPFERALFSALNRVLLIN